MSKKNMMPLLYERADAAPALPNFLVVGAAKCGTTSLYYYLKQHPEVYMSPKKEPGFLSGSALREGIGPGDALDVSKAMRSFDDYCILFERSASKKAVGEASTDTFFQFERTIPAIQHYLGDPCIVIILRDPVKRAYSAYNYLVREGREKMSFKNALIAEEQRKQDGYLCIWQYEEGGLYARRVRAFQEHFSRVKVLFYDDLERDAASLLRTLYAFLGVNPDFVPNIRHRHNISGIPRSASLNKLFVKPKRLHKIARTIGGAILGADRWIRLREHLRSVNLQEPPLMDYEIEQQLRQFYRDDILKLQDYIGKDLSCWLEGKHL